MLLRICYSQVVIVNSILIRSLFEVVKFLITWRFSKEDDLNFSREKQTCLVYIYIYISFSAIPRRRIWRRVPRITRKYWSPWKYPPGTLRQWPGYMVTRLLPLLLLLQTLVLQSFPFFHFSPRDFPLFLQIFSCRLTFLITEIFWRSFVSSKKKKVRSQDRNCIN